MEKDWEEAPGKVMLDDYKNLLVPGIMDGNIFITVQRPADMGWILPRFIMILM